MSDKTTKEAVKKWPLNDFLIALEKILNEHGATLQATTSGSIGVACGCYTRLSAKTLSSENIGNFINDSLRPENQMKEQKMDKQYKYVPVTGMDIWDLGKEVSLGVAYFDELKHPIYIDDLGCLATVRWDQGGLLRKLEELQITTRKSLPWYEVEGVFDNGGVICILPDLEPVVITDFDGEMLVGYQGQRFSIDAKPLTQTEAAKYGVVCD